MNKSILVELLRKFTTKEIRDFDDYIHSPFFNKNESVIKLFEYIKKHYPDFSNIKLNKESVFGEIFPNVKYNDGFMRTLMFKLTELTEAYLAFTKYRENEFTEKKYLLAGLNEKELDRHIEKKMKEISKELEGVTVLDADYYINRYMIDWEYLFYLTRSNLDKLEKYINRKDAEKIFNNLTYFYLLYAIRHYLYTLIIRNEYSIEFKTGLLENIFKNLDPKELKDSPVLELYYNVLILFLNEKDVSFFYKVKDQIRSAGNRLNNHGLRNIYTYIGYFCRNMIRKGRKEFIPELFDVYEIMLDKKIYALQREMSANFYKGAVDTALKLKKFGWAAEFIEKYRFELPGNTQENTYYYCLALCEFASKKYEHALELLRKVRYTEVYQKLHLRCLIAELYYELNYDSQLLSHIDSFRHFLSNDDLIPAERKKYYSSFINYTKSLNRLRGSRDKEELSTLLQKLKEDPAVYNKEWLLEKAVEH